MAVLHAAEATGAASILASRCLVLLPGVREEIDVHGLFTRVQIAGVQRLHPSIPSLSIVLRPGRFILGWMVSAFADRILRTPHNTSGDSCCGERTGSHETPHWRNRYRPAHSPHGFRPRQHSLSDPGSAAPGAG